MVTSSKETKIITKSIAEAIHINPAQVKMGRAKNSPTPAPPPALGMKRVRIGRYSSERTSTKKVVPRASRLKNNAKESAV